MFGKRFVGLVLNFEKDGKDRQSFMFHIISFSTPYSFEESIKLFEFLKKLCKSFYFSGVILFGLTNIVAKCLQLPQKISRTDWVAIITS